jgi:hypothetical protein
VNASASKLVRNNATRKTDARAYEDREPCPAAPPPGKTLMRLSRGTNDAPHPTRHGTTSDDSNARPTRIALYMYA